MKTSYLSIAIISFLMISCSSNEDTSEQYNLIEISQKLNTLAPSAINQNDEGSQLGFKNSDQSKKALKTTIDDCLHTTTESEVYNDITYTYTTSYFDKDMNAISDCDTESQQSIFEFNTVETQVATGPNLNYAINALGNHRREFSNSNFSYTNRLALTGDLDFDGNRFKLVEGSYIHLNLSFSFIEIETDNITEFIDIVYKFEFEANGQTYHFDMIVDGEYLIDLITSDASEIVLEYSLYDASNTKIGIVTYVQDFETELEKFILFDLDGNLIE